MRRAVFLLVMFLYVGCSSASSASLGSKGTSYALIFKGLGPNVQQEFEATISQFSEYRTHRTLKQGNGYASYKYVLALSPSELKASLEAIIAELELNTTLRYNDNKKFEIESR